MLEFFLLSILVGLDIVLTVIFRYLDSTKPTPLSSMEFHFFVTDFIEKINFIIDEDSKERRKELFDSELRQYDRIKKQFENGSNRKKKKN